MRHVPALVGSTLTSLRGNSINFRGLAALIDSLAFAPRCHRPHAADRKRMQRDFTRVITHCYVSESAHALPPSGRWFMMNRLDRRLFVKSIRNMRNALMTHINRRAGREFVPGPRTSLSIEASSICNLDCCFCAYPKKQSPRVVMSDDFFKSCVSQARVTSSWDRHLFNKLELLDKEERVQRYGFFTNFTIPKVSHIEALHQFKKMNGLAISVYGHDLATFKDITWSTETVYRRLVRNLELLLRMKEKHNLQVFFIFHTGATRCANGRAN